MEMPLSQLDPAVPERRFRLDAPNYSDPFTQEQKPDTAREVLRGVRDSWDHLQRTDPH